MATTQTTSDITTTPARQAKTPRRRAAEGVLVVATGLTVIGALAGCSTGSADAETGSDATSGSSGASGGTASGTYTDGSYTEEGGYQSPGGQESISVTLELKDGVVESVDVKSDAASPNAVVYQKKFISGIEGEVVGKNIDDLQVSKVAGSSLTSQGFNAAVEAIKADAAQ